MSLLFKIVSSLQKIEAAVCNHPVVVTSNGDSSSADEVNTEIKTESE